MNLTLIIPILNNLFSEELQQSQILIIELQKKLNQELNRNIISVNNHNTKKSIGDTLDNIDSYPICCTKCTEEIEIKIRQIENLKKYPLFSNK